MDETKIGKGTLLSAIFLVAGTSIGGGMLALPIATGINGFFPSIVMMAICWLAMTASALLLIEVCLWMEEGAHIITMSSRILGPVGKAVSWIIYLFICYASIVAYTAGGGLQIAHSAEKYLQIAISKEVGCFLFIIVFGGIVYLGSLIIGRVNAILFSAMIAAYFALIGMGLDEIKPSFLIFQKWQGSTAAIPLLLTGFSFQTMVPSLTPILKRNPNALRIAIIGGTTLTFLIYIVWQALILGIVPVEGTHGLLEALQQGVPATLFLHDHVEGYWIAHIAEYFAFFAIVTSFLGICLGLFDFLSDGLNISNKGWGHVKLGVLVLVPTLFFAIYFERAFLTAMDSTGGFGDTILNGLIPVMMVWIGRYRLGYQNGFRIPGGRPLLLLIGLMFLYSLVMETLTYSGFYPSMFEPYDVLEVHNLESNDYWLE